MPLIIAWYTDDRHTEEKGRLEVPLETSLVRLNEAGTAYGENSRFDIVTPARVLSLNAESIEQRDHWVTQLRLVLELLQNEPASVPEDEEKEGTALGRVITIVIETVMTV